EGPAAAHAAGPADPRPGGAAGGELRRGRCRRGSRAEGLPHQSPRRAAHRGREPFRGQSGTQGPTAEGRSRRRRARRHPPTGRRHLRRPAGGRHGHRCGGGPLHRHPEGRPHRRRPETARDCPGRRPGPQRRPLRPGRLPGAGHPGTGRGRPGHRAAPGARRGHRPPPGTGRRDRLRRRPTRAPASRAPCGCAGLCARSAGSPRPPPGSA
ncbi:LOW QUALITY PROTEIN: two-component system sensor kinase, partial [Streptomyces sviceus ATCC 29083]